MPPRVGRYEVTGRLGAGGMGIVYLATDPLLRRTVAIKVLPAGDDADLRERFMREARSVAALRHPNIVTVYDIGEDQGRLFIAMERIEGQSMADAISGGAEYSVERRLQLLQELCAGLGYAHKAGIIHRDIKPGNLMIDVEGSLKVLDFGLARLAAAGSETGLTRSGALVGTPNYMSPEQVRGEPIDHRSDIFSVGLVFYEWLSGHRAFSSESIHTLLHDIAYTDPRPIRSLVPSIDPWLASIVEKALKKDPAQRYQALDLLASDLGRLLARAGVAADISTKLIDARETVSMGAPMTPPPPQRSKITSIALPGIAAALVAAISIFLWQGGGKPQPPSAAAPAATQAAPSAPPTEPPASPPASQPAPAVAAALPQVTVDMLPWARVRIVPVGHDAAVPKEPMLTPFSVALAPGEYRLECENDGVSPRTIVPISVVAGRPLNVTRAMQGFSAAQLVDTLLGGRP